MQGKEVGGDLVGTLPETNERELEEGGVKKKFNQMIVFGPSLFSRKDKRTTFGLPTESIPARFGPAPPLDSSARKRSTLLRVLASTLLL